MIRERLQDLGDDEEEMLRMQEEFLSKQKAPSAKVTRLQQVSVPPAAAQPDPVPAPLSASALREQIGHQQHAPAPARESQPVQASITGVIEGILGNVTERAGSGVDDTTVGSMHSNVTHWHMHADIPMDGGFPAATHRKMSKFALGRRTKTQTQAGLSAAVSTPSATSNSQGPSATAPNTSPKAPYAPVSQSQPPASAAPLSQHTSVAPHSTERRVIGTGMSAVDASQVQRESAAAIASMSSDDVQDALKELHARMDPKKLEFLRQRGAEKLSLAQSAASPQQQQQLHRSAPGAEAGPGLDVGHSVRVHGSAWKEVDETLHCKAGTQANAAIEHALHGGRGSGADDIDHTARTPRAVNFAPGTSSAAAGPHAPAVTTVSSSALHTSSMKLLSQGKVAGAGRAGAAQKASAITAMSGISAKAAVSPHQGEGGKDAATSAAAADAAAADNRLVARVRFSLDAQVVGVARKGEVLREDEVLKRDALRMDEGAVPHGYTLGEMLLLARSSMPPQRAAGLSMLADVLHAARPRAEDFGPDGRLHARIVPLAAELMPEDERPHASGHSTTTVSYKDSSIIASTPPPAMPPSTPPSPMPSVSWPEVWALAVCELCAAQHIRLALDDERAEVVGAAAAALAALVAPSTSDVLHTELADLCPATGWPAASSGYLYRRGCTATWQAHGPDQAIPPAGPRGPQDDPELPEDVALLDPLAGLMQMGLLPRLRHLLTTHAAPAATRALLSVLCSIARSGEEQAEAVLRCSGLMDAVMSILKAEAGSGKQDASVGKAAAAGRDAVIGAEKEARQLGADGDAESEEPQVLALMLLRLLCQASSACASALRAAGCLRALHAHIVMGAAGFTDALKQRSSNASTSATAPDGEAPTGSTGASAASASASAAGASTSVPQGLEAGLMLVEALRIWRVCTHQGISACTLDDVYSYLAPLMQATRCTDLTHGIASSAADATSGTDAIVGGSDDRAASGFIPTRLVTLAWVISGEVHSLLAALIKHAYAVSKGNGSIGDSMIGPGAAGAIAQQAVEWLQPAALRCVAQAAVSQWALRVPVAEGVRPNELRELTGTHPALLLPHAAAMLASAASVLHCLATYWGTVGPEQLVFGQMRSLVSSSGLLASVAQASTGMSAKDQLAICLLSSAPASNTTAAEAGPFAAAEAATGSQKQEGAQRTPAAAASSLGGCFSAWLLEQVANPPLQSLAASAAASATLAFSGNATVYVPHTSYLVPHGALSGAMLRGASGEMLAGILALVMAVHRELHPMLTCAGRLAQAAVAAVQDALVHGASGASEMVAKVLCPWHAMWLQDRAALCRLACTAAACSTAWSACSPSSSSSSSLVAAEPISSSAMGSSGVCSGTAAILDVCLSSVAVVPPGSEALCMEALRTALQPCHMRHITDAAWLQLTQLHAASQDQDQQQGAGSVPDLFKLASTAAGLKPWLSKQQQSQKGHGGQASSVVAPYPLPSCVPDAQALSRSLLESYAASWLFLLNESRMSSVQPQTHRTQPQAQGAEPVQGERDVPETSVASLLALCRPSLSVRSGSRLPAPAAWMLLEAHDLPSSASSAGAAFTAPSSLGAAGPSGSPSHVAAANRAALNGAVPDVAASGAEESPSDISHALLLALGMEGSGSALMHAVPVRDKLRAVLSLVFVFQSRELFVVQEEKQDDADARADAGAWQHAWVRWPLAALMHRYTHSHLVSTSASGHMQAQRQQQHKPLPAAPSTSAVLPTTPTAANAASVRLQQHSSLLDRTAPFSMPADWANEQLAEQLCSGFASASFGDPLYALLVALLLLPPPTVRMAACMQAWDVLIQEQALHLLPPLEYCLGTIEQYIPSLVPSQSSMPESLSTDPKITNAAKIMLDGLAALEMLGLVGKALSEQDLDKAVDAGSAPGGIACAYIGLALLDRSALQAALVPSAPGTTARSTGGDSGNPAVTAHSTGVTIAAASTAQSTSSREGQGLDPIQLHRRAAVVLRTVVRSASPHILVLVLSKGVALTLARDRRSAAESGAEACRALLHACEGDGQLMDKAQWALKEARLAG